VRPSPKEGAVVTLRVVFILTAILSCGFLCCVPMLRIAILRRRALDWFLFWASLAWTFAGFAVVGSYPQESWQSGAGVLMVMLLGPVVAVYYLVKDIALHKPAAPAPVPYGPVPQPPRPHPYDAYAQQPPVAPYTPAPPPFPQPGVHPHPPRIDRVRAELDELSDYLRNERNEGGTGNERGGDAR
jgi:hypothetical protein